MSNHWLKTTLGRLTFVCGRPGRPIWTQWWAWCQMLHQALILSTPEKHGKAPVRAHRMKRASTSSDPIGSGNRKRIYQNMLRQMSASHEKSPTELTLRQHPSSRSSSTFSFCVWVPVCATLACWQVSNETRSVLGQTKMVPVRWTKYPAVPTGLAVGTNPPGLPSGDHRWGVWEWVKSSVPRIRSVGYSSIQIRY